MNAITHNWSGHVVFGASSTQFPQTTAEVQDLVRRSPKVRPIGSRHSFNDLADTTGALVSLRQLERRIEIDPQSRTVRVDGGITYAELCPVLEAAGWALFNLASCPDFSIVGAVATATHGSGNRNRNLAGSVAALEIVTASGDIVSLKRGDADFDGAVVGIGTLGIVTAMTLDLVPSFEARQNVFYDVPFEVVVDNFEAVMGRAYSVSLFTHWNGDFVDTGWVKSLTSAPLPVEFFGGQPATAHATPVRGTDPTGTTPQLGEAGPWFDRITHASIGVVPPDGLEVQAEYFMARADAPAAMRAIKAIEAGLHPVLIVSEIRTVAGDDLWLSTAYGMDSVGIHFAFRRDWAKVRECLVAIEATLAPFNPRPHWGKLFLMPAARIRPRYPRFADFVDLAHRHDPAGKFRNAFLDTYVFD